MLVSQLSLTCLPGKKLLLALLFLPLACSAQTWTLPLFTADAHSVLAAAARYHAPEGSPGLILDYQIAAQIDESGRLHRTTRMVTKVLRVQGIDAVEDFSIPWSLARQDRPVIKARVITSDGEPHLLADTDISERDPVNPNAVGAVKLLKARLPQVDIDCVVELQLDENDHASVIPGVRYAELTLQPGLPIAHFKASIGSLSASALRVETRSFPEAKITNEPASKGHAVSVEASAFQPYEIGSFLPPDVAPFPSIVFSNATSWQSVAQGYAEVIGKSAAPASSTGEQLDAVEKIYEEMRRHIKDNGLDLAIGPVALRAPADILKSGLADSKDEAAYLISKLAQSGIAAKMALISTGPRVDLLPSEPGFEAFNRALVYVPAASGSTPLWFDPTAEYTSVFRLPVADQQRWALIVDPATTALVHTPGSSAKDNVQSAHTEVHLGDGNPTKVSLTLESSGFFQDSLRGLIAQLQEGDEETRQRVLQPVFHAINGQQVVASKYPDPHNLLERTSLEITGEGYSSSFVSDDGGYIELPGPAQLNYQKLTPLFATPRDDNDTPSPGVRKLDYYIPPPFMIADEYHIFPPPGYSLKAIPPAASIHLGPATITGTVKLDADGSLWHTYSLISPKDRLSPKDVETLRTDIRKVSAMPPVHVELENIASAKMRSGDFVAGLKLLRDDASRAPDSVNPQLRLAATYVVVGARPAGIKLCEDLLKRYNKPDTASPNTSSDDQNLAAIYSRLGWSYEHDEFGRFLSSGMNAEEAEKNLHKALDLSPGDVNTALQLANLYTYNPAGVRFGRSARLNDAADIYTHLDLNTIARSLKLNDYALLLLRAHRYNELRELFLLPQGDAADQSIKWAGFAASRSPSDLKEELEFRYSGPNERRAMVIAAGRQLVAAREYQAASRLFALAGKGPGIGQAELDRLNRVRVFDDSVIARQPSIAVVQRYVQALLDPAGPDEWKKLVADDERSSTLQAERHALLQELGALGAGAVSPDVWPYLSDLINTTCEFTVDGSDAVGFRIRARFSAGNSAAAPVIAYVVKTGDQYVIAGLANSNTVSAQAVAAARSGNLESARQWLEWARESAAVSKLPDDIQPVLDFASAQLFLEKGKPLEAVAILQPLHQANPSATATTILLTEALIQGGRFSEAMPLIDVLEKSGTSSSSGLRLEEHLLAQQGKYADAAVLAKQVCATPKASASDWNDLAWLTLFTSQNASEAETAAQTADKLSNHAAAAVLQTLAIAQAMTLHLQDARATAYKFAELSGDSGEMLSIFGTISEQLGLPQVASSYYSRVPKENSSALSNYSFAQLRIYILRAIE